MAAPKSTGYTNEAAPAATVAARDNVASGTDVRWWGTTMFLRQIDVQRLYATADRHDAIIELALRPGQFVRHGDIVLRHSLGPGLGADGAAPQHRGRRRPDMDQDPLFAFRLLAADIGLRAQSPAINDPATCRHTIDAASGLLRYIADRHLGIGEITDADGHLRVLLHPPTWEEFVGTAFDELIEAGRETSSVAARIAKVLDELIETVPAQRRQEIEDRRTRLAA